VPATEVFVWWARTDELTESHLELLDDRERERWAKFRRREDRDRFALGSTVVRSLVAELDGTSARRVRLDRACPKCGAQHGPVTTPGRAWRCSVSHSGPFAVAAVVAESASASAMIGVDLETRCPQSWPDLLPGVLAPGEAAPVSARGFLTLWVRKEATLKATQEGLSRPMSSIRISGPPDPPRVIDGAPSLRLVDLDMHPLLEDTDREASGADTAAAVAVDGEDLQVYWRRARV
jgi:4'-phosphopantetheinyl transferase